MEEDIKQKYEYYFTYDKPIPYISIKSQTLIDEFRNIMIKLCQVNTNILLCKEKLQNKIEQYDSQSEDEKQQINNYSILLDEYDNEINKNTKLIDEYEIKIDNLTLLIHPVLMSDYFLFYDCVRCLLIEKNKISDPKIISMSYLDFLFHLIDSDENREAYLHMFIGILRLCLKVEDIKQKKDEKDKVSLMFGDIEITKKDFDIIKRIICYQNMPSFDDTYIDPELEQALKEAEELKNKDNAGTTTLERQMICVSKGYPYKLNELYDLTIRKFVQMLQVADAQLHYQIYKTGECGGMVSFKEPIMHYMYTKDTKFDSMSDYKSFKEKLGQVT